MMILGSIVLIFTSVAVFAQLYASAARQTSVLITTTSIEQGQQLSPSDLGEASVSISGDVSVIPAADASELRGKHASVTIPAGSLLTVQDVTNAQPFSPGDAVVGMALKSGQLPSAGVEPGDEVMVVETGPPGTSLDLPTGSGESQSDVGAATSVLVRRASVFGVETPQANSESTASELVSVEVPQSVAAVVSSAAAADQTSLVLLPPGSDPSGSGGSRPQSSQSRQSSSSVPGARSRRTGP
jgi:hypothetical protein